MPIRKLLPPYTTIMLFCLFLLGSTPCYVAAQPALDNKLDSLLTEATQHPDDTNKVWLYHDISYRYFQVAPEKGIAYGKRAIALSEKLNYPRGVAYAHKATARCYAIQNNYTSALQHFYKALSLAGAQKDKELEGAVLISLGGIYKAKGELDKALTQLDKALEIYKETGNTDYLPHVYNNIGNVYDLKYKYSDALNSYLEGLKTEEQKKGISGIEAKLNGNIGITYTRFNDYENAFKYLFRSLSLQRELGNTSGVVNILNSIGATYRQVNKFPGDKLPDSLKNSQHNLRQSVKYLLQAAALGEKLGRKNKLKLIYNNLSDSYEALGDYKNSLKYYQQYSLVNDSLRNIVEERKFARMEAEFAVKKKTDSLKFANELKDKEVTKSKTTRDAAILLLALAAVLGIVMINRHNMKRKKLKAEKDLADNKLISASHRLTIFTKNLQEKNRLIENFTEEIERLQALPCSTDLPDTKENLAKLQSSIILTDEQWDEFRELFETVHGGFLNRLKQKLPDLTPAETRFMALSKLKLSNKEMAGMLGIGLSGMRNYKYRLRKKLSIDDDSDFEELIDSI